MNCYDTDIRLYKFKVELWRKRVCGLFILLKQMRVYIAALRLTWRGAISNIVTVPAQNFSAERNQFELLILKFNPTEAGLVNESTRLNNYRVNKNSL